MIEFASARSPEILRPPRLVRERPDHRRSRATGDRGAARATARPRRRLPPPARQGAATGAGVDDPRAGTRGRRACRRLSVATWTEIEQRATAAGNRGQAVQRTAGCWKPRSATTSRPARQAHRRQDPCRARPTEPSRMQTTIASRSCRPPTVTRCTICWSKPATTSFAMRAANNPRASRSPGEE